MGEGGRWLAVPVLVHPGFTPTPLKNTSALGRASGADLLCETPVDARPLLVDLTGASWRDLWSLDLVAYINGLERTDGGGDTDETVASEGDLVGWRKMGNTPHAPVSNTTYKQLQSNH